MFLGNRDDIKAVKNFIDQVQLGEVLDGRNQIIAVESWVLGAVVEKARQRLDVGGMAGSCWHEFGRIARLLPITRGMTQRTIEADARITNGHFSDADRQFNGLSPRQAERAIAADSG